MSSNMIQVVKNILNDEPNESTVLAEQMAEYLEDIL